MTIKKKSTPKTTPAFSASKRANAKVNGAKLSKKQFEIISIHQFSKIAMTFWLGGSWMTAAVIFPIIFDALDPIASNNLLQQILHINAYIGIVCLGIALVEAIINQKFSLIKTKRLWYLLAMGLILMINDFSIFPTIYKFKKNVSDIAHKVINVQSNVFDFWHSFSALLFIVTCILGVLYLIDM